MKRYICNRGDAMQEYSDGPYLLVDEVSALLSAVAEEVRKIELSGWADCERAICADNRDAHKRALALLEQK